MRSKWWESIVLWHSEACCILHWCYCMKWQTVGLLSMGKTLVLWSCFKWADCYDWSPILFGQSCLSIFLWLLFGFGFCFCWIVDIRKWQETWGNGEGTYVRQQWPVWLKPEMLCVMCHTSGCWVTRMLLINCLRKGMCILKVGHRARVVFWYPSQLLNLVTAAHAQACPGIQCDDLSAGCEWAKLLWSWCLWRAPFFRRGEPKLNKYLLHPVCIKGLHTWLWRQSDIKQGGVFQPPLKGMCAHAHKSFLFSTFVTFVIFPFSSLRLFFSLFPPDLKFMWHFNLIVVFCAVKKLGFLNESIVVYETSNNCQKMWPS